MREIYIKYNPYIVKTVFKIDGKPIGKLSEFYEKQENVRLQEWIEPSGEWEGFFKELRKYLNSSDEISIIFEGTDLDYADLMYAYNRYGDCFKGVNFKFIKGSNDVDRLELLKEKFEELKNGPIEELRDKKIQESFKKSLSSEFEIVVVSTVSSGKSTLINAILGIDLLPAYNKATTSTITRITNDVSKEKFVVTCKDKNGKVLADEKIATFKQIDELNKLADETKNIDCINIQGNISNIHSDKVNIVFVDTPGGNNAWDEEHKEVMKKAINDENKGMILFVFDYTQLDAMDCDVVLSLVAQAMVNASTGKQARDRFIFVCNKMDEQNLEKEPYDQCLNNICEHLRKKGINEPNLFLTCAEACKLIRMKKAGIHLTDSEDDKLEGYLKPFNRPARRLFMHSSISQDIKNEFSEKVEEIANTGEKRSEEVAEINSGIPALERAISQYISKYAQAIKIKTVHDVFMKRVMELDMKAKCEAKWSESEEEYEKMRADLKKKEIALENDKKLQIFKERVEAIEGDYSQVDRGVEALIEKIMGISNKYKDVKKVEKTKANDLINECYLEIMQVGEQSLQELEILLENCVYKQCKDIIKEYKGYIKELDRDGLLNIGEYSFKKIASFDELTIDELENISKDYISEEVIDTYRKEKPGFFNAIKRFFGIKDGWAIKPISGEFVLFNKYIRNEISNLEWNVVDEINNEINRAKKNEEKLKAFTNDKLNDINKKVAEEMNKVKKTTSDKNNLKQTVDRNKKNMEWLGAFVEEMSRMLDV